MKKIVPDSPNLESSFVLLECRVAHAVELLNCATATAYESAESLHGQARHLAMASMHLITQAQLALNQTLDQWPTRAVEPEEEVTA
ncbi:DUF3077 domain-containing protein [uncultured Pseudomonas sp.]|uniref:DUF6124 family protein n=1 Tax=uncultured Pseudomonas sp. TaxID=114707 RepID=UPI0025D70667|nr:DUF3077 domain-containing protein [uncultured Pseudomonas sp.]